jgi:hypothetical protein
MQPYEINELIEDFQSGRTTKTERIMIEKLKIAEKFGIKEISSSNEASSPAPSSFSKTINES